MNYETAALADILAKRQASYVPDDENILIVLRYVGDEDSATVTVSGGDITFQHGDLAAEAVDATINSDDDDGVIDVSDAGGNTMGKVVDLINGSANWEALLCDCLRADASTAAKILDVGETTLTPNTETMNLNGDTSATLNISKLCSYRSLQAFLGTSGTPFAGDSNYYVQLTNMQSYNTFGSGTNIIQVYDIDPVENTEKLIYQRPGAATTVEKDIDFISDMDGLDSIAKGHMLLVRMIGSTACTGWINVAWKLKEY